MRAGGHRVTGRACAGPTRRLVGRHLHEHRPELETSGRDRLQQDFLFDEKQPSAITSYPYL